MDKRHRVPTNVYNAPDESSTKVKKTTGKKDVTSNIAPHPSTDHHEAPPKSTATPQRHSKPAPKKNSPNNVASSPKKGTPPKAATPRAKHAPPPKADAASPKHASIPKAATPPAKQAPQPVVASPKHASSPKAATPPAKQAPPPVEPSPKHASPPKAGTPPKTPLAKLVASPPKTATPKKAPTPVVPVTVQYPPPPMRPASQPAKVPPPAEGGQILIHAITPTTNMSDKIVRGRITGVTQKVLNGNNMMEILLNQVTSTIGVQVWLREKKPSEVFARMPQEGHIVQISKVTAKKSAFDPARYHEAMLSGGDKIRIQIVDDPAVVVGSPFSFDPILLPGERSASSSQMPDLNVDNFYEGF